MRLSIPISLKKSVKKCKKRGLNLEELSTVVDLLQKNGELPAAAARLYRVVQ